MTPTQVVPDLTHGRYAHAVFGSYLRCVLTFSGKNHVRLFLSKFRAAIAMAFHLSPLCDLVGCVIVSGPEE